MNSSQRMLDIRRHSGVFQPSNFLSGNSITLIGAGPVGSRLARHLAQLGLTFDVFDREIVSNDFLGAFGASHRGLQRADALHEMLLRDTGSSISGMARRVTRNDRVGNVVFFTDGGRKERLAFFDRFRDGPAGVDTIFDVRPSDDRSEILVLQPAARWQLEPYRRTLEPKYWQPQRELTLPVIAEYAAAVAASQLIRWFKIQTAIWAHDVGHLEAIPGRLALTMRCEQSELSAVRGFAKEFCRQGLTVTLVGAGALGSRVGRLLAQFGISFEVFDPDVIESHNVPNQAFGLGQIGARKVEALASIVQRDFGVGAGRPNVTPRSENVSDTSALGNVVFVCPDNMACRKLIWEKVRFSTQTELVVEGRMGENWGKVYTAFTRAPSHLREYGKTLHGDEVAAERTAADMACRATTSVGPTAECIASRMVWQLIRWFVSDSLARKNLHHEIFEYVSPYEMHPRCFS